MRVRYLFFFLFAVFSFFQCRFQTKGPDYKAHKTATSDTAMVVSPHPLSTEVGLAILKSGGNAVDATVATHFAMAVVMPRAGNIGGGGFFVYRSSKGEIASLDYREKAPVAASRDMYLDEQEAVIEGLSTKGHLAVGVPGTVAGLLEAHRQYGSLPLADLLQPVIRLAREGFEISKSEADRLNTYQEAFAQYNSEDSPFIRPQPWKPGDRLKQLNLAKTLERIRDQGRDGFYKGETAALIAKEMERGGGLITLEDLAAYQPQWRTPITTEYDNYRIISMPPPSSGGIALTQLLQLVEPYPLHEYGFHSIEAVHLMAEAERRVYADRAAHLGDSDFYEVPRDRLLDSLYLSNRMADFSATAATESDSILAGDFLLLPESYETTHTSIVDDAGNAVSLTTTLNSNYGSKVLVHGAGFFLNNEMDDFSVKPGVPNQFGLIGAEANAIQPGKRMLSSMTPTIVEKDGELFMVLGAPGGSTIITAVFQTLINVIEFNMPLADAVSAGRFHHQWLPDMITIEKDAFPPSTRAGLENMGHEFREIDRMAVIKAIQILEDGSLQGAADFRNPDDDAQGY